MAEDFIHYESNENIYKGLKVMAHKLYTRAHVV